MKAMCRSVLLPLLLALVPLPGLAGRSTTEVNVNVDFTEAGRKLTPPTRDHPTYYLPLVGGYGERGEVVAGEKVPPPSPVLHELARTLANNGYLVAGTQTPVPTVLLTFSWGSMKPKIESFGDSQVFLNQKEMVALVGGQSVRNLDLASAAGAASLLHVFPLPAGVPEGELPSGDFVLASPLAGWRSKQWPLERYATIAGRLQRELGMPLVLNVPPATELPRVDGVWPHQSSLAGLIHATRRARAVVGVDSGPLHLAAALARPGVAIYGPTDPARNGPYGGSLRVLRSAGAATTYKRAAEIAPSMLDISAGEVFEHLRNAVASAVSSQESPP